MRVVSMFAAAILVIAASASAQADDGRISAHVAFVDSEEIDFRILSYRVYGEEQFLRFRLLVVNESDAPVILNRDTLRQSLQVRLTTPEDTPVDQVWLSEHYESGDPKTIPDAGITFLVDPQASVGFVVDLARSNGEPFGRGQYEFELYFDDFRAAVRKPDNTPWIGRVPSSRTRYRIHLAPPASTGERVAMHLLTADRLFAERDFARAADAYATALSTNANERRAAVGFGLSLMSLRRYAEAIPVLERLPGRSAAGSPSYPPLLARAYLGAGDERNAVRVLREAGYDNARLQTVVRELREINRRGN